MEYLSPIPFHMLLRSEIALFMIFSYLNNKQPFQPNSLQAWFSIQFISQKLDVLIETTRHRPTGLLKGLSSNYIPILIDADDDYKNKLKAVRAQKFTDDILLGTILS